MNTLSSETLSSKLALLSRPDGSAIFCQGGTIIMTGVYGPVNTNTQKILIDKANVETHYRPKSGMAGVGDRFCESVIKNICETALLTALYPRTSVFIVIHEMQSGTGLISCAINAACLALLDAGIAMKFLVGAVSCVLGEDGSLHLNPTSFQVEKSQATFTFAFDSVEKQILASHTTGCYAIEDYGAAVNLCRSQSEQVFEFMRDSVKGVVKEE